jgi:carbamoyltransferase
MERLPAGVRDEIRRLRLSDISAIGAVWLRWCRERATSLGLPTDHLSERAHVTDRVNAVLAASTQRVFEESMELAGRALVEILERDGPVPGTLCLTGGTALNVVNNTRLARAMPFDRVFVEAGCDDSGLAVGAALAGYHVVLDQPLASAASTSPYLGAPIAPSAVEAAIAECGTAIVVEHSDDPVAPVVRDLLDQRIVGWLEGRSEIGPRALGHRSVIADPRGRTMWPKLNAMKGREAWRPLAPAVLAEAAADWFDEGPLDSPYMCFNVRVRSKDLPAITHVDGSARVQTVAAGSGRYYDVLRGFQAATGVPVLINTSLNGPGEPIVERPEEALRLLLDGRLDVLYLDDRRVTRAGG